VITVELVEVQNLPLGQQFQCRSRIPFDIVNRPN